MKIIQLLHASLLVQDLARACQFYEGVLGLERSTMRPDLGYPGAWYELGTQQLHVLALADAPQIQNHAHPGRDRHVALAVEDIQVLRASLEAAGIAYTTSRSGRAALFCRDPDGNGLEFIQLTKTYQD